MVSFFGAVLLGSVVCWLLRLTDAGRKDGKDSTHLKVPGLSLCRDWNASKVFVSLQSLKSGSEAKTTDWHFCNATSCASLSFGTLTFEGILDKVEFGLWVENDDNISLEAATEQLSLFELAAEEIYDNFGEQYTADVSLNSTRADDYGCANTLRIRFRYREGEDVYKHNFLYLPMAVIVLAPFLIVCLGVCILSIIAYCTYQCYLTNLHNYFVRQYGGPQTVDPALYPAQYL